MGFIILSWSGWGKELNRTAAFIAEVMRNLQSWQLEEGVWILSLKGADLWRRRWGLVLSKTGARVIFIWQNLERAKAEDQSSLTALTAGQCQPLSAPEGRWLLCACSGQQLWGQGAPPHSGNWGQLPGTEQKQRGLVKPNRFFSFHLAFVLCQFKLANGLHAQDRERLEVCCFAFLWKCL